MSEIKASIFRSSLLKIGKFRRRWFPPPPWSGRLTASLLRRPATPEGPSCFGGAARFPTESAAPTAAPAARAELTAAPMAGAPTTARSW